MNWSIEVLKKLRTMFLTVAETGLALIGFILVIYVLLGGDSGNFVISVIANISLLIDAISPQAIIGVALVLAAVGLLKNRR